MGGGWWITDLLNDPTRNGQVWVVSWAVWVIFSICIHELAHGWVAIKLGDDTPRLTGHMTWNPIVHMGPMSMFAFVFFGIAWGMMPVNPTKLRGRYADAIVSLAGPLMNCILAVVALICLILWVPLSEGQLISSVTVGHPLSTNLTTFFHLGAMLNIILMMFNLLPVPPLDGGRILMDVMPSYRRMMYSENARWVALGVMIVFFMIGGMFLFQFSSFVVEGVSTLFWAIFFPNLSV
jgi:Zn-dependent protease